MSRWHSNPCLAPNIFVDDEQTPNCRSCGASARASLERAKTDQRSAGAIPAVPPDEPSGRLDLRWPPMVPYVRAPKTASLSFQISDLSMGTSFDDEGPGSLSASRTELSPVYGHTLGADEFRLVCLEATGKNSNNPNQNLVHLSLETYSHGNCPEYETVSYTWAGENGDNNLCRPVFVGPYWDILFSTNNCWSMLRYLRPWRGIRMVWIDAVCINQHNTQERDAQVAKMNKIYTECSRAVLWLGEDVVHPTQTHASRHQLYDLESGRVRTSNPLDLHELHLGHLLTRRYFKRVWVIQELILSRRVIIPIGDKIFWADASLMENWSLQGPSNWKWENTDAPWVQNITRGVFPADNAYDLVAKTSKSQASDLRDRLFGVLGLLKDDSAKGQLLPDYTSSHQQVFVGFFAYSILNLARLELLFHARGCNANQVDLTWVPNWRSSDEWESIFNNQLDDRMAWEDFASWVKKRTEYGPQNPSTPCMKIMKFTSKNSLATPRRKDHIILQYTKYIPTVLDDRPWNSEATVNADTGALSINLTRLVPITSRARRIDENHILGLYEISLDRSDLRWRWKSYKYFNSPRAAIYMVSREPLDKLIKAGEDEIFILQPAKSKSLIYLILRKTEVSGSFKLVACCANVCFGLAVGTPQATTIYPLEALQLDLSKDMEECGRFLDSQVEMDKFYPFMDGQLAKVQTILPFYLDIVRERIDRNVVLCPDPRPFGELYISLIDPSFSPQVHSGYVELQVEQETLYIHSFQSHMDCHWTWSRDRKAWKGMQEYPTGRGLSFRKSSRPIIIRCPVDQIRHHFARMMDNEFWYRVEDLYRSGLLGYRDDQVQTALRNGPTPEDRFIATPFHEFKSFNLERADFKHRYGEDTYLPNQLGVDGSTYKVEIR